MEDEQKYRVLLYQRGSPEEFGWNKVEVQVFLGTCLGSESLAAESIAEADKKSPPRARWNTRPAMLRWLSYFV
jgi:hypothetical protein